jgi:hypothetical protein
MPNNEDIQALIQAISEPRLSSYRKFFRPQSDEELLGIYRWNEEVCTDFSRHLKWIEIALRNGFHAALSQRYGVVGTPASRDWYHHVRLAEHSRDSVRKITHQPDGRPRRPAPTPDDVVAKLTFGFWPILMEVERDRAGQPIPWSHMVPEVVPGHRQKEASYWRALAHRDALQARLELCKDLRNRIAHHEPIWKQGPLLEETKPRQRRAVVVVGAAPRTPDEAMARLQLQRARMIELIQWLSPAAARLLNQDPTFQQGEQLLQAGTLQAYRQSTR